MSVLAAVDRRRHQRLQGGRVDRHAVERLRRHVDDQVHAPVTQVGQPVRRGLRGDEGLAGEVLEPEAGQLVVRRDEDVAVACGLAGQRVRGQVARRGGLRPHPVGDEAQGQPGRAAHGVGGEPQHRVGVQAVRQAQAQQRVGVLDVVGVLAQDADRPVVVPTAEHDGPGVGEVARHLGLDAPHRPLLEDLEELGAVRHGGRAGLGHQLLARPQLAAVQAGDPRVADARDGDGGGLRRPLPDEPAGGVDVPGRAAADDPEPLAEEGHPGVVVPLGAHQADVDDHGGPGCHVASFVVRRRQTMAAESSSGCSTM